MRKKKPIYVVYRKNLLQIFEIDQFFILKLIVAIVFKPEQWVCFVQSLEHRDWITKKSAIALRRICTFSLHFI